MKIADIKIVTNALKHGEDLTFTGWIHPQIDPNALILMLVHNNDLTGAPEYSVLVEADTPIGPYTTDISPIGEFAIGEMLDSTVEAARRIKEVQESQDELPFDEGEGEEIFED